VRDLTNNPNYFSSEIEFSVKIEIEGEGLCERARDIECATIGFKSLKGAKFSHDFCKNKLSKVQQNYDLLKG
jgi:hypothetical protein